MSIQKTENVSLLERRLLRERAARKEAERLLIEKSRELYQSIQESESRQHKLALAMRASQEAIWSLSRDGRTIEVLTWPMDQEQALASQMTMTQMTQAIHPDDQGTFEMARQLLLGDSAQDMNITIRRMQNGGYRWYRIFSRRIDDDDILCIGITKDVTRKRHSEHEFKLMATAFAQSRDAMAVLNTDKQVVDANPALARLLSRPETELTQQSLASLLGIEGALNLDQPTVEVQFSRPDGKGCVLELTLNPFFSELHNSTYTIATLHDVTARKQAQATLVKMATHDSLTGLPNRAAFQKDLARHLTEQTDDQVITVFFIDLDGFKAVNDDMGHDAGDEVLLASAERLRYWLPDFAHLARWGGDEFLIVTRTDTSTEHIDSLARQIIKLVAKPLIVQNNQISISASIGLAQLPGDANNPMDLIKCADIAMYEAKGLGKNQFFRYRTGLLEKVKDKMSMVTSLRHALEIKEFDFYLQPKCDSFGQIIGAEALARWSSPYFRSASPGVFIPLIEEHGLSIEFGKLALTTCAHYIRLLTRLGYQIPVAVNISAYQLMSATFQDELIDICNSANIDYALLEIEVTESIFLQDTALPITQLLALKEKGFRIAIDDFGTGYSSLSYLRELPFDIVKIDRSFVVDADQNERAATLLQGIVDMCHNLNMTVVAEGIETQGEFDLLRQWQVESYQGYLLGKPMPFDDFALRLQQRVADDAVGDVSEIDLNQI